MPSLLLCEYPTTTRRLCQDLGIPDDCIRDSYGREPERLHAHTPYLLGACHDLGEQGICSMLEPHGRVLSDMCRDFGESTTLGLADLTADLRRYGMAGVGAGANLYSERIAQFLDAVEKHQGNMLAYHRATRQGLKSDTAAVAEARDKLVHSGSELNRRFALELDAAARRLRPRQRTLMSDRKQMPELVSKARQASQLNVGSHIEASRLVELSKNTRCIGRMAVVVDLGFRADEVFEAYQAGEDWQRKAVVETAGVAAGVYAGTLLTRSALTAIGVVLAPTPVGWALILGTGLAAAGYVVSGSSLADLSAKYVAEHGFDAFAARRAPSP